MQLRIAFAGFRHGHIFDLLAGIRANPDLNVVAACEEDAATRESLKSREDVKITHENYEAMLREVPCDIVAIGDFYTKRGKMVIQALESKKHVISDKPVCCTLDELDQIEKLSKQYGLAISTQFDLRNSGAIRKARELIQAGEIGEIQTISFSAQHPLMLGVRPGWYFQPGCHGGTINDIAIHAMDIIPWITGRKIAKVQTARAWNARTPQYPHFQDAGQLMLTLDNQGGVMGDVSYLAPEACGFSLPQYWRFTFHGSGGLIECSYGSKEVMVVTNADKEPRFVPALEAIRWAYLPDFLAQVRGETQQVSLSTQTVLDASRWALTAQQVADFEKASK
jgi:predicted dehydrogenase